jgi:3-hydroxymyristoyl/3-hydroxydecanoyl-(acyl carrier protein) dehydratase
MIGEGIFAPFIQARGHAATLCVPPHHPCFSDHQVRSMPVLPGVSYLELVLNAA